MPKVRYKNITFDSDLEVEYYKYLKEQNLNLIYHPHNPIYINSKNTYTPDFIVFYNDRIEIVETKGFNQFSYMRDNMIHNVMLEKTEDDLKEFLIDNDIPSDYVHSMRVIYKKIKFLKSFGWVDFDFKNPNTIANKRKEKINELEQQLKELINYKKNTERYFSYLINIENGKKLTKPQVEWIEKFETEHNLK